MKRPGNALRDNVTAMMQRSGTEEPRDNPELPPTHLFTLRLWMAEIDSEAFEWRGRIQRLDSGEIRYFRDVDTLYSALLAMLDSL